MPLHYTTFNGNVLASELLLKRGADPDAANRLHVTPLWNAVYATNFKLVRILLRHNVRLDVASRGIQQHATSSDITPVYDDAITPLNVSWEQKYFEIFKLLVLAGARTDHVTQPWIESLRHGAASASCDARVRTQWLETLSCPLSLKCCARASVRRHIGRHLVTHVDELMLPKTLVSYLLFDDI